jgi:hypothetical protein|tara:strand:- start:421 stop:846 length:426 start_codon:yes stop_codon:yes gene_type:complete
MPVNNTPLINGRAYDFAQIVVNVLGVPLMGISSVTYAEEQEKTNNYGAGKYAVSRGHGAVEASASFDIHMNDIEALRDAAPLGRLLDIPPFDVPITFLNANKVVTHVLKNCEFTNDGVEASQGDTQVQRTFDLVISHVEYR